MKTSVLNSLAITVLAALMAHPLTAAEPLPGDAPLSLVEQTQPADANQKNIQRCVVRTRYILSTEVNDKASGMEEYRK